MDDGKRHLANQTSRIICKKELWVPSARIRGCHPGKVSLGGFLKRGGMSVARATDTQVTEMSVRSLAYLIKSHPHI